MIDYLFIQVKVNWEYFLFLAAVVKSSALRPSRAVSHQTTIGMSG